MWHIDDQTAVADVRIRERFRRIVDGRDAGTGLSEEPPPFVARFRGEDPLNLRAGRRLVRCGGADGVIGVKGELCEVGPFDRRAELLPEDWLVAGHAQVTAALRLVDGVVRKRAAQEPHASRRYD